MFQYVSIFLKSLFQLELHPLSLKLYKHQTVPRSQTNHVPTVVGGYSAAAIHASGGKFLLQPHTWIFFQFIQLLRMLEGVSKVWYQGILKATVSDVFEDLKFKISEGLDQNQSCPDSALLAVSV